MKDKLLLFLFLFFYFISSAQNYFKGTVTEEGSSMSVTNAIVAIEGTTLAERTDLNGAFNFSGRIPNGDHVVTITKDGYVTKYILIEAFSGKNIIMNNVKIEVGKKERKRRKKAIKAKKKLEKKKQKKKEKLLDNAEKEKKKNNKKLEKQKKKLQKEKKKKNKNNPEPETPVYNDPSLNNDVTSLQIKFGSKLNVTPTTITNSKLYEFIQSWEGTNYLLGGETEEGIDCSSFTQRLYTSVYDVYIERTAEKQFNSKLTDKFLGKEFLREGDLIFFKGSGENQNTISHVGIYLHNDNFVHATSYTRDNGLSGVKISSLSDRFWSKRFVAGGRRISN